MSARGCIRIDEESIVLKDCLEYLKARNIYCWRNNTGAIKKGNCYIRYGYKGSADIIGICPDGRFLAVECKKHKGGKLSEEQKIFLNRIRNDNGVAIIANSLESLVEALKNHKVI